MSYEVPSDERNERLLRKEISEQRDLIRFTPTSKQNDHIATGAGSHDTSTGVIKTSLVLNPSTMYEAVQISWTGGSGGDFQTGHVFKTNIDTLGQGWRGILLHIVSGDSTAGTGVFEPIWLVQNVTPRPEFDNASTTLINETVSGWTASYTGGSKDMGNIVPYSASLVVDKMEGGNPDINVFHGAKNNGHIMTVKPKDGKTLTLSTGGNIDILSNVIIEDDEIAILQYHEDAGNKWLLLSGGGGSGNVKTPVKVATTGNSLIHPTHGDVIDGITVVAGDRVLVKNQTEKEDNGIYKVTVTAFGQASLERDVDMPHDSTVYGGTMVYVESGTDEGGSIQILFTNSTDASDSITVGTDDQDWYASSGGEVFTWSADHDANFNNLNNLEQVSFVDSANDQRGFIAGQTDAIRIQVSSGDKSISFREDPYTTDILYINRYGINQGHATGGGGVPLPINPSAGFISIANDQYMTWRNSTNTNDALLRFNASDQLEFNFNSIPMLKIDQPNTLLDFEQNDITRVNNINSYTGNHDIGNTDPFHRIFANRFIPVSQNYVSGTTGELRQNDLATYMDLPANGTFDIRRNGVGQANSLVDGSDPWFRFSVGAGTAPDLKIYHNGTTDPKFTFTGTSGDNAEIYYNIGDNSLKLNNPNENPTTLEGITLQANGSDIATLVSTGFHPNTDDSHQLGTSSNRWSEVLCSGVVYGGTFQFDTDTGNTSRITSATDSTLLGFMVNGVERATLGIDTGGGVNGDGVFIVEGDYLGGQIKLFNKEATPDDGGIIGQISFDGYDNPVSTIETYALIKGISKITTNGSEEGAIKFELRDGASSLTQPVAVMEPTTVRPSINGETDLGDSTRRWGTTYTNLLEVQKDNNVASIDMYRNNTTPATGIISAINFISDVDLADSYKLSLISSSVENISIGSYASSIDFQVHTSGSMETFFEIIGSQGDVKIHKPVDLVRQTVPSNPDSIATGKLFYNSADNHLSFRKRNDADTAFETIDLEGAGGGVDETADYSWTGNHTFSSATHQVFSTSLVTIQAPAMTIGNGTGTISFGGATTTMYGDLDVASNYLEFNSMTALTASHTSPSTRRVFQDSSDNHLKIRTDTGLIDLEAGGGANTSLSNLVSGSVSINADMIPDISGARNLGGSTQYWGSGFISNSLYFGSGTSKRIYSSATNDLTITVPSGGDIEFQEGTTNFFVCDGGTNEIIFSRGVEFNADALMDGGNAFRSHDTQEIGFMVTNSTMTTGTEGTVQIPWLNGFSGSRSNADTDFGNERACIGIMESGGVPYLMIKSSSGGWYGVAFSSQFY